MDTSNHQEAVKVLLKKSLRSFVSFLAFNAGLVDKPKLERISGNDHDLFSLAISIAQKDALHSELDPTVYIIDLEALSEWNAARKSTGKKYAFAKSLLASHVTYSPDIGFEYEDGVNIKFKYKRFRPEELYQSKVAKKRMCCKAAYCKNKGIAKDERYWEIAEDFPFCNSCVKKCYPMRGEGVILLDWDNLFDEARKENLLPFRFDGEPFHELRAFREYTEYHIENYKRLQLEFNWLEFAASSVNKLSETTAPDSTATDQIDGKIKWSVVVSMDEAVNHLNVSRSTLMRMIKTSNIKLREKAMEGYRFNIHPDAGLDSKLVKYLIDKENAQ